MSLETVKLLLGVDNDKVSTVYSMTEKRLLGRLKGAIPSVVTIPKSLEYIVDEVTIIRFNRIGSEGMATESEEGHSATYIEDDFKSFKSDIDSYIESLDEKKALGVVRFL